MKSVDVIVVGAGLTGGTLAREFADKGKQVLVIEKRNHLGGNVAEFKVVNGLIVHQYGPHIFHTNDDRVVQYLSRFTEWREYKHRVLAEVATYEETKMAYVPLPINVTSLEMIFGESATQFFLTIAREKWGDEAEVPILKMRRANVRGVRIMADYLYERVFCNYTMKQWGRNPEELDPGVTARVPIRLTRDDNYFRDKFQAQPRHGYNQMIYNLFDHPGIEVRLEEDFWRARQTFQAPLIFWTGPIDQYFQYDLGPLPYRSIEFEFSVHPESRVLPVGAAVVNLPSHPNITRITEMKDLTGQVSLENSVTVREYPGRGNEPLYPVPQKQNLALYKEYAKLAEKENASGGSQIVFAGRLGRYQYIEMAQAVAGALALARKYV